MYLLLTLFTLSVFQTRITKLFSIWCHPIKIIILKNKIYSGKNVKNKLAIHFQDQCKGGKSKKIASLLDSNGHISRTYQLILAGMIVLKGQVYLWKNVLLELFFFFQRKYRALKTSWSALRSHCDVRCMKLKLNLKSQNVVTAPHGNRIKGHHSAGTHMIAHPKACWG